MVFNPGFELVDDCPQPPIMGYGPGQRPAGWFTVNSSPDYFNRCQPYGNAGGVPLNWLGWQEPVDGDAYSGMLTYLPNTSHWHELIGAELMEPLMIGAIYYVSFHINAAAGGSEWPMMASSHYGALFTMDAVEWNYNMPSLSLRNYAHVYHPAVMGDTASWLLVSGSFVADSAYRYIVLGNHFDNAHTETDTIIFQADTSAYLYRAYTYVDQVCVSLDPQDCPMAQGMADHAAGGVVLFPNPATNTLSIAGLRPGIDVLVVDAVGRVLWQGASKAELLQLDVSVWSRGCYAAVVHDGKSRRSFKFVLAE